MATPTMTNYWLTWRVFICLLWILISAGTALYVIVTYERRQQDEDDDQNDTKLYNEDGWNPSLRCIHPVWLLIFRIIGFIVLILIIIHYLMVNGGVVFHFYPIWTLTLNMVYFGVGILLSSYGCYKHIGKNSDFIGPRERPQVAGFWTRTLQIMFQMLAGAVVFAFCIFWGFQISVIVHKTTLDPLDVCINSTNLVLLVIETVINNLKFPWFRVAYFIMWTWTYVIFQWIIHFDTPSPWPYFFLDVSSSLSPLWYLLVPVSHVLCYGAFFLLVKLKQSIILNLFPNSIQQV